MGSFSFFSHCEKSHLQNELALRERRIGVVSRFANESVFSQNYDLVYYSYPVCVPPPPYPPGMALRPAGPAITPGGGVGVAGESDLARFASGPSSSSPPKGGNKNKDKVKNDI